MFPSLIFGCAALFASLLLQETSSFSTVNLPGHQWDDQQSLVGVCHQSGVAATQAPRTICHAFPGKVPFFANQSENDDKTSKKPKPQISFPFQREPEPLEKASKSSAPPSLDKLKSMVNQVSQSVNEIVNRNKPPPVPVEEPPAQNLIASLKQMTRKVTNPNAASSSSTNKNNDNLMDRMKTAFATDFSARKGRGLTSKPSSTMTNRIQQTMASNPVKDDSTTSRNPVDQARFQVENMKTQVQDSFRMRQEIVLASWNEFRESIFDAVEKIENAYAVLQHLPADVAQWIEQVTAFVAGIPDQVEQTMASINAIPDKVEQRTTEIKSSVDETVETTRKVVDEVKAIPQRVQATAKTTQEAAEQAMLTMSNLQRDAKKLFGIEQEEVLPPETTASSTANKLKEISSEAMTKTEQFVQWAAKGASDVLAQQPAATQDAPVANKSPPTVVQMSTPSLEEPALVESLGMTSDTEKSEVKAVKDSSNTPEQGTASKAYKSPPAKTDVEFMDTSDIENEVEQALFAAEKALKEVEADPSSQEK